MNEWFYQNIIYITKHGSCAYGLNTDMSDLDLKGIVVPPATIEYNLFNKFEQAENDPKIHEQFNHLKNPNNPKIESTIFSLRKFISLAANVNPNIIELLYTIPKDHLLKSSIMEELIENRNLFLSSRVKYTFGGYSHAQLAKIQRHRKWIVMGELKEPKREDYKLSPETPAQINEIFDYIKSEVERWNLSKFAMDDLERNDLKETIWELIYQMNGLTIGWDNWPQVYEAGIIQLISQKCNLKDEIIDVLNRERQYRKAKHTYISWLNWKKNRNPERAKIEEKYSYDCKHSSHLVRLLRMAIEILTNGNVIVNRPDKEELMEIRNGAWTYDQLMEYSNTMHQKLDIAYKVTSLPQSVNYIEINKLYHSLYEKYWSTEKTL